MQPGQPKIKPELIPQIPEYLLIKSTINAFRRAWADPEKRAAIEKRAAEIRERGEYGCGGNQK